METKEKQHITDTLGKFIQNAGSQNKAATQLGVAPATLSAIRSGKWEAISDDMWSTIAHGIGITRTAAEWNISTATQAYQHISYILADAQQNAMAYWLTGEAGCGKTTTARQYAMTHRGVFYIQCSIDMKRSHFVTAVATAIGIRTTSHYPYEIWEDITQELTRMEQPPVLIFDEADKLSDSVFQYFIDLYNKTYGQCGIVWMSTDSIKVRFDRGLKWSRQGYKEIFSRIGQKFNDLPATTVQDVVAVCHANGVTDRSAVEEIATQAQQSGFDMRHVKKQIHKYYKVQSARKETSRHEQHQD